MRLALLGDYSPTTDEYHRAVVESASDEVLFLGAIYDPDVVRALRFHSIGYLHGHTVGGTNPSLVEALAAGNPVIAHDNKYNRWVAGDAGLYFSSSADVDLAVSHILADSDLRQQLGVSAQARFNTEFTWDKVAGEYESLLRKAKSVQAGSREEESPLMVNVGIIGLGKMGLSHYSIINAHDDVKVVGVCDSSGYVLDVLSKYTGVATFSDFEKMLDSTPWTRWSISTPSKMHAPMVRSLSRSRSSTSSARSPSASTRPTRSSWQPWPGGRGRSPRSATTIVSSGPSGRSSAFSTLGALGGSRTSSPRRTGPWCSRRRAVTWRSKKDEGGGALYDYAAHPLDLLTWYFGRPESVSGTVLGHGLLGGDRGRGVHDDRLGPGG